MPNVKLRPYAHASSFRRIAAAAWDDMYKAAIHGQFTVRVEPLERWIEDARAKTGRKITLTHCIARAVAIVLARHPDMNALVMRRKIYLREDVDLFLQVAIPSEDPARQGKTDLSGVTVRQADRFSVSQLHDHIAEQAKRIRAADDKAFELTKRRAHGTPGWLLGYLLKLLDFLQFTLNVDTTFLGAPRDPFGSCMITSVGMFDAPVGWAPFFPLARCPLVVCIGSVLDEPVVEDGRVVPGRVVNIQATLDHRVIDGFHAGVLARSLKALLLNPEQLGEP